MSTTELPHAPEQPAVGAQVQRRVRPLAAKLRYMGRQYAAGQAARGGCVQRHYLEDAADAVEELDRILESLGCVEQDAHTDPVAVIDMLRGWEVDATVRADRLAQHLRGVLEIARTWQPDYATKMDRDTLQHAEDFANCKTPNADLSGRTRSA